MASIAGPPKRHRDKRLGERRRDAGSSRDASEEGEWTSHIDANDNDEIDQIRAELT
jgi:hypothetical protein